MCSHIKSLFHHILLVSLVTFLLDYVLLSLREISCWSLLEAIDPFILDDKLLMLMA